MLIAIEGCLGVGKTTVAEGLGRLRKSVTLLENFESNPFLTSFYSDPVKYAVETEFSFLLLHFHQLKSVVAAAGAGEVVSDFHLWKDLIYADLNLTDPRPLHIFKELHGILSTQVPSPSIMVLLRASSNLILERIAQRKRTFEVAADPDYFARVNDAYEAAFESYPGRKIAVQMDRWDFVKDPRLFATLSLLIDGELQT